MIFSRGISRSTRGARCSRLTCLGEQSSHCTFLATSHTSAQVLTVATQLSSVLAPQYMRNPLRMWAGRTMSSISSYIGRKDGGDFAFHPTEMAFCPRSVFIFQRDHGDLLFGLPENLLVVSRVPAIFTWNGPSCPFKYCDRLSGR